jgi:hypothetical protein
MSNRMMFEQLSTTLRDKPESPIPTAKSPEMYPKVRFWTQNRYNEWANSPEGHGDPRYKLVYLEDEAGMTIPDITLKSICKTIRGCWAELVAKNMVPKSWGKANASAKELVYSFAYKSFPFLQLAIITGRSSFFVR